MHFFLHDNNVKGRAFYDKYHTVRTVELVYNDHQWSCVVPWIACNTGDKSETNGIVRRFFLAGRKTTGATLDMFDLFLDLSHFLKYWLISFTFFKWSGQILGR